MSEVQEKMRQIWQIDWVRCCTYGAWGCLLGLFFSLGHFCALKLLVLPLFFIAALFERTYVVSTFLFWLGYFALALSWLVQPLMFNPSAYSSLIPVARLGLPAYFSILLVIPVCLVRKCITRGRLFQFWPLVFAEFAVMYFIGHGELGFPWALPGYCDSIGDGDFTRFEFWGFYGETLFWLILSGTAACSFYPMFVSKSDKQYGKLDFNENYKIMMQMVANNRKKNHDTEDSKTEDDQNQSLQCTVLRKCIGFSIISTFFLTLAFHIATCMNRNASPQMLYSKQELTDYKIRCVHIPVSLRDRMNPSLYLKNFRENLSLSFSDDKVDFVIWPEANIPWLLRDDSEEIRRDLAQIVPQDGYLLTGAVREDRSGRVYNSLVAIDRSGETIAYYDKKHLAPFGEYVPFRRFIPKFLNPIASSIGDFDRGEVSNIITLKGLKIAVAICYEAVFPGTIVPLDEDVDAILVISNDAWFGKYGPESKQFTNIVRMRAVEEGIPVIKVSNCGPCIVFDGNGIEMAADSSDGFVSTYRLPKKKKAKTLYRELRSKLDKMFYPH